MSKYEPNVDCVVYELEPEFDSRKSFYSKAYYTEGEVGFLYSYGTQVAEIMAGEAYVYEGVYSDTTLRHIKEYLKQNGFRADTKSQIMADYGVKV